MTTNEQQPPHVIETASATTDPDNARSGSFAYIIAGVAIAASLLLGLGMRGCVSVAADLIGESQHTGTGQPHYLEEYFDNEDNNDWFDDNGGIGGDSLTDGQSNPSESQTVEDLIGSGLAMFDDTIDANLSASTYANAQQAVSSYVRDLVVIDKNASSELAKSLRDAAWNSRGLDEALEAAHQKAEETKESISELKVPEARGEQSATIDDELKKARKAALDRWDSIIEALDVLARSETLSESELAELEEAVAEDTQDAATHFSTALRSSAER